MHIVVERFAERTAQLLVIHAAGVNERDVVLRERDLRQWRKRHAIRFGIAAHRRMHGAGEAMKKAGLDAARNEQLPHIFQCVDRFLHGLRRETVHQVRVYLDSGVSERAGHSCDLRHRDALLHQLQQPIGGDLETT